MGDSTPNRFSGRDVRGCLARVLVELARSYGVRRGDLLHIGVSLTQPELAALVGAAEPTVHRALTEFRRDGVIETGYRRTVVRDWTTLRQAAGLAP
jgi:CRP/FNR family transcriptional regulator, cyclic AMP receptor protein